MKEVRHSQLNPVDMDNIAEFHRVSYGRLTVSTIVMSCLAPNSVLKRGEGKPVG